MELILLGLLAVMIVFMVINGRRRQKALKEEQEQKAERTVPGVKVLLQGGLYGTVVSYDPVDLDKPAEIELAPGVVVEVHSQAILRLVEPEVANEDAGVAVEDAPAPDAEAIEEFPESVDETRARLDRDSDVK